VLVTTFSCLFTTDFPRISCENARNSAFLLCKSNGRYRILYMGCRSHSAMTYFIFLATFACHIGFWMVGCLGFPGTFQAGLWVAIKQAPPHAGSPCYLMRIMCLSPCLSRVPLPCVHSLTTPRMLLNTRRATRLVGL
jgi:hypothetical protein